jgi:hypothetical protein
LAQQPRYAGYEAWSALRDREAVLVELERAWAILCLRPCAPHLQLPAPIPLAPSLFIDDDCKSVAPLALPEVAVHFAISHG